MCGLGTKRLKIKPFSGRGLAIVIVLLLVNILNFVDRQLPFILIDAIRTELHLNDTEIGLMAGVSFAVVYSFAALGLAWAADRFSARWVIGLSLAFWSVMTAAGGLAQNFFHLLLARAGVAAGEAGSTPAAHAMIARLFPDSRRALVLAIFSLGVPIGGTIGLALGGWINDAWGWREAFFFVGLPGVIVAILSLIVLPRGASSEPTVGVARTSYLSAMKFLFGLKSFRHMAAASSLFAIGSYAMNVFAPAFLMRTHGMTSAEAGLGLGLVSGIGGLVGTFAGGMLADVLGKRDTRWRQWVPAIAMAVCVPVALGAWLAPDALVSMILLALVYMLGLMYFAPTFSAAQSLAPDEIRATASAVLLFCLTIVGSSAGPYVIGWASDYLTPRFGHLSLRYAMCLLAVTMAWSALHFFLAARALKEDLAAQQLERDRVVPA
ncbi:MAG: MFS transporter [Caulobacteraceae bacterium]|nr:MFS transporter [Caulobacteraceae bacterium]